MAEIKTVGMGELKTGREGDTLAAYGIGSCVVVVCYDKSKSLAGMLHGMLPERPPKKPESNRYLDVGIENLIKALIREGSGIMTMEAKICGGASMFDIRQDMESIGERNAKTAEELLRKKGIAITGSDTGSNYGRNIEYSVDTRKATVRSYLSGTKIL